MSIPVEAWSCTECVAVHRNKEDADACCLCTSCRRKFKNTRQVSLQVSLCDSCSWTSDVQSARDDVERTQARFNEARDYLAKLISERPPGTLQPKEAVPPRDTSYMHPDGTRDSSAWAPLYEVRDWLYSLAESIKASGMAEKVTVMAAKVTAGIKATGGGNRRDIAPSDECTVCGKRVEGPAQDGDGWRILEGARPLGALACSPACVAEARVRAAATGRVDKKSL